MSFAGGASSRFFLIILVFLEFCGEQRLGWGILDRIYRMNRSAIISPVRPFKTNRSGEQEFLGRILNGTSLRAFTKPRNHHSLCVEQAGRLRYG